MATMAADPVFVPGGTRARKRARPPYPNPYDPPRRRPSGPRCQYLRDDAGLWNPAIADVSPSEHVLQRMVQPQFVELGVLSSRLLSDAWPENCSSRAIWTPCATPLEIAPAGGCARQRRRRRGRPARSIS
jgi:hypothetical protein